MIKILNIITGGLGREGITTTQLEFMKRLNKSSLTVDIAVVNNAEQEIINEFKRNGCNVILFPNRKKNIISYIKYLNKILKKNKYDIIHVHGSSSLMTIELLCAKLNHVKVRIAHSRNTRTDHKLVDMLLRPIFYSSYNFAIACGSEAGQWLFKNRDFFVLHNGKNLNEFKFNEDMRQKIRKKYKIENKLAIGFVGNLNEQKNIPFLLEIIKNNDKDNDNCIYFIIGDGKKRKLVEDFLKDNNLEKKVILTGRINNVNEFLNAMDIMLLPSLYEGLPNVVLEWQVSGVPSLISDKITKECKVLDLVEFLPINQGVQVWIDSIKSKGNLNNRTEQSVVGSEAIKKSGFDISENVLTLENLYFDLYKKYY